MKRQEFEIETKMRRLASEMIRPEGTKMLELLLERSTPDEIVEAIKLTKLGWEVKQIAGKISGF